MRHLIVSIVALFAFTTSAEEIVNVGSEHIHDLLKRATCHMVLNDNVIVLRGELSTTLGQNKSVKLVLEKASTSVRRLVPRKMYITGYNYQGTAGVVHVRDSAVETVYGSTTEGKAIETPDDVKISSDGALEVVCVDDAPIDT